MKDWLKGKLLTEAFGIGLICSSLLVLLIASIVFIISGNWTFSTVLCEEKVGQYGDFIGGVVGTLLALSASVLYYIALREQQKDVKINQQSLEKQLEEFSNQVKEQKLSREIYESQLNTMKKQQFESSFYSYFSIYQSVRDQVILNQPLSLVDKLKDMICDGFKNNTTVHTLREANEIANTAYLRFFVDNENNLSFYFRTLYRLIKQIDASSVLSDKEKWFYCKIIRSQMSTGELYLNYYNSFSPFSTKIRYLLYKYNFFKHFSSFSKTEIKQLNNVDKDVCTKLILFSQIITPQIVQFINSICDNVEVDVYETDVSMFNCKLKIEQRVNDIVFHIFHDTITPIPENFMSIIAHYLEDVLFLSSYKNMVKSIYVTNSTDTITGKHVYSFSVQTEYLSRLIEDAFYEK